MRTLSCMGGVLFYTCKAVIVVKEKIAPNRTCSLGQNQKERKRTYFAAKMTPVPNRVYIKRGRIGVRFFMQQMLSTGTFSRCCLPMVLRIFTFCFACVGAASLVSAAFEFWSGSSMTGVVNGSLLDLASGETVGKGEKPVLRFVTFEGQVKIGSRFFRLFGRLCRMRGCL